MELSPELLLEIILSLGLCLVTIPIHEYGHKFAFRVLGIDSHIIWRDRANEHWWSFCVSCVPEEPPDGWVQGTPLEHAFIAGSGGAVQACVFIIPMLFFNTFGFFTIGCIGCLFYMFCEIIIGHITTEWTIKYQEEEIINE